MVPSRAVHHVLALLAVVATTGGSDVAAQSVLTADDHAEIQQLYASYNLTIDSGDADAWADTFTPDGVFGNSEGRAALVEFAKGFHETQQGHARHWNTNIHVTPTEDGAVGTCYLLLWNVGSRPASVIVSGIYHDTLVKTDNGWRFSSRRADIDPPADSGQ